MALLQHQHVPQRLEVHRVLGLLDGLRNGRGAPLDHLGTVGVHNLLPDPRVVGSGYLDQCVNVVVGVGDGMLESLAAIFFVFCINL